VVIPSHSAPANAHHKTARRYRRYLYSPTQAAVLGRVRILQSPGANNPVGSGGAAQSPKEPNDRIHNVK